MDKVSRIKKIIDVNYNRNFTVEDLSAKEGINSSYLKIIFKERYGNSIYSYKKALRLINAESMLMESELPIYEIVHAVGYANAGKFARAFKEYYNFSPFTYRAINSH
ncbi:MAG: helix-turn-helix transcriptional regulator [Spirochaetales bacterium]|nr:helix-turn-helix transcriptional regulator [Spirochaetales bacterium]